MAPVASGRLPLVFACLVVATLAAHAVATPSSDQSPLEWASAERSTIPDLPRPLSGHAAGLSHGALIVAGGTDFPASMFEGGVKVWFDAIHVLPRGAKTWQSAGRLPQPLAYAATGVIDDRLIVAGGSDSRGHRVEVVALEWVRGAVRQTALSPLPAPIAMAGSAVLGRTLFVAGGQASPTDAAALATVWALDLSAPSPAWRSIDPLPGAGRLLPVVAAQAGRLFVFSGAALERDAAGNVARQYLRDSYTWTSSAGWRRVADTPQPLVAAPVVAAEPSEVVVFGGDTGADAARVLELKERHPGFNRDIVAYDRVTDTWRRVGVLPVGLVTTAALTIGSQIAIVGGEDRPGHRSATVSSLDRAPMRETPDRTATAPQSPSLRQQDVFSAGEAGAHTYRIPSIIATKKGTLLAFAEARRIGASDAGDIDLVMKRSVDGGASWSSLRVVSDAGPDTVGNPCPVVDARTGTVWLLTTRNRGVDKERDIIAGTSEGTRTVWVMRSDDDGVTWSAPIEITSSVKEPAWTWYATGPGIGIQMKSGRLVVPANHAEAGTGVHRSHLMFSDDGGARWRHGESAEAGTNESQVVELADGRLMLNMRNHPPKPENHRLVATSGDGGQTLSSAVPDRALIEPPAQASLIAASPGRAGAPQLLVFANAASAKRERMTVRLSEDEGRTWPFARLIHEGPSAYSSLVLLPAREIGLLYERGGTSPYERITFVRLPLDSIREHTTR
jgi:sialidase-1